MSLFIVSHYYPLRGNLLCRSCSESWIMASPPISLGVSLCYFFFFTHSVLVSKRCQFLGNVPQIHTLFSTLTIHYLNFTSLQNVVYKAFHSLTPIYFLAQLLCVKKIKQIFIFLVFQAKSEQNIYLFNKGVNFLTKIVIKNLHEQPVLYTTVNAKSEAIF